MKQIGEPFAPYYYLTEDGKVFNIDKDKEIISKTWNYRLKTIDGTYKNISLKKLYKQVYGKVFCDRSYIQPIAEDEEWKELPGTEGNILASNYGRIMSLIRYEAAILKPYPNKRGYLRVDLFIDGKRQCMQVSRLVAAAWLPLPLPGQTQIHHKANDEGITDKADNRACMLQWVSPGEHKQIHLALEKKLKEKQCNESNT